jgi:predicted phosphate transport protein (TIGR00153 family)
MPSIFAGTRELTAEIDSFLDAISQAAIVFQEGIANYMSGDAERFAHSFATIGDLEKRADELRRSIESQLYRYSLIPESRGDVLDLLESMDEVIDTAKNTMSLFVVERPEVIPELREGYVSLSQAASRTAEAVVLAARAFFRDPRGVTDHLHKVYYYEKEGDTLAMDLKRKVFDTDLELAHKIHLRYFALNVDRVSDAAEGVADKLSIYAIKRTN